MTSNDMILGIIFLFQTGFGSLGNFFLLGIYAITFFTGPRLRPIDLLLFHLALVNVFVLLSIGIPQTMAALGLNNFLDDIGCKFVFYIHQVARGLSLCTTCFLSGFQVITLSPRSSRWGEIKARIPKCIVPFCSLGWTFHLLIHYVVLLNIKSRTGIKNITESKNLIYCHATLDRPFTVKLHAFLTYLSDVLCVGIMVGSSGYMVFILYRHHQRVQYIHDNNLTPSSSPETRAIQTILMLVCMFFTFYSLNSVLALYIRLGKPTSWLFHSSSFLDACFPAWSPLVVIFSDSQVPKYSLALRDKIKLAVQKNTEQNKIHGVPRFAV